MGIYLIEMFGGSLLLTWMMELPVAFLFGLRSGKKLLLAALVNLLTNPPAVLFFWLGSLYLPDIPEILMQIVVETVVVIAEACIYCSFSGKADWMIGHPVMLAVTANGCSWLLGGRLLF